MFKKFLALLLVVVLTASIAVAGTLAYLTSEDSEVNVMTLGNVSIKQHEYERVLNADGTYEMVTSASGTGYKLQEFTQAKPLLPGVGSITGYGTNVYADQLGTSKGALSVLEGMENVQDKFVTVENTGKSDAYVRTLIAFEQGTMSFEKFDELVMMSLNDYSWTLNKLGTITVENNNYYLVELVYKDARLAGEAGVLPAGAFTSFSLGQVYLMPEATNEDCEALDGNGNGTYDILVLSQAVQTEGFDDAQTALDTAFGKASEKAAEWFGGVEAPTLVYTVAELQAALDSAADGDTIIFGADITGDVTVTQKANVKITLDGNGKTYAGVITVDGKSATYTTAGLTIKNLTFKADSISADACIRLGDGTNATRYTCNVSIVNCTFDVPGAVGVKSYTGGDKNLTISGCTATAEAHSLVQAKGIDGILVENCKVYSIRGINFNNSDNITVDNCTFDVLKYAVRFGESANTTVENYAIINSTIKSANDDGDAAIVLRAGATNANLTLTNTTIDADTQMSGHENANIIK